jgi:hypothetical protein
MPLTSPASDNLRGPAWTTSSMIGAKNRVFGAGSAPVSTAWPTANTAILVPFAVAVPTTFAEIFFQAGTTPGTTNYDLGLYRDDFTRIASLGSTAAVSTTDAILPAGGGAFSAPVTLTRGRYYIAMNSAATSLTVRGVTYANSIARALGCISMAVGAVALPATITPAQASTVIPVIGITTVTNIL